MKKTMSLLLFIICVIALAGCSSNSMPNTSASGPPVSTAEPSTPSSESGLQGDAPQPDMPAPSWEPSLAPVESGISEKKPQQTKEDDPMPTLNIQVGNKNFTATLYDNDAMQTLLDKLPLTLNMGELNGNEKFYFFSERLPTDSERVENIKTGDLMLYGSDCLVLFYESFSTSYSYTRLGYIEDVAGLADALGHGSVEVTFGISD